MARGWRQSAASSSQTNLSLIDWAVANVPTVDGEPFTLDDSAPLRAVYADDSQARHENRGIVAMKGAQTGLSVYAMLKALWRALRYGINQGYYLPDQPTAFILSGERFAPLLREIPALLDARKVDDTANKMVRRIGRGVVYFLHMGGKTSKESIPLRAVYFDEVHQMLLRDIEIALERLSGSSTYGWVDLISTAGYPDCDIDWWFRRRSDQRFWHSLCGCPEGVVLTDFFVDNEIQCIRIDRDTKVPEYFCPRCGRTVNPLAPAQVGQYTGWVPTVTPTPELYHGYQFSQTISRTVSAGKMLQAFRESSDLDNLYQRKVGIPRLDPSKILVTPEHLEMCIDVELEWETSGVNCAMGCDQMGSLGYVVIKRLLENGKTRFVWLAVDESLDYFSLFYRLMRTHDVQCCVIEALPNYNEALRFAQAFPGRVFVASYHKDSRMVRWGDRDDVPEDQKRSDKAVREPWTVTLNHSKVLEWSLKRFKHRENVIPNPRGLVSRICWEGTPRSVYLCETVLFTHLQRIAREITANEDGTVSVEFKKLGMDPHFVFANALCDVACMRTNRVNRGMTIEV